MLYVATCKTHDPEADCCGCMYDNCALVGVYTTADKAVAAFTAEEQKSWGVSSHICFRGTHEVHVVQPDERGEGKLVYSSQERLNGQREEWRAEVRQ